MARPEFPPYQPEIPENLDPRLHAEWERSNATVQETAAQLLDVEPGLVLPRTALADIVFDMADPSGMFIPRGGMIEALDQHGKPILVHQYGVGYVAELFGEVDTAIGMNDITHIARKMCARQAGLRELLMVFHDDPLVQQFRDALITCSALDYCFGPVDEIDPTTYHMNEQGTQFRFGNLSLQLARSGGRVAELSVGSVPFETASKVTSGMNMGVYGEVPQLVVAEMNRLRGAEDVHLVALPEQHPAHLFNSGVEAFVVKYSKAFDRDYLEMLLDNAKHQLPEGGTVLVVNAPDSTGPKDPYTESLTAMLKAFGFTVLHDRRVVGNNEQGDQRRLHIHVASKGTTPRLPQAKTILAA